MRPFAGLICTWCIRSEVARLDQSPDVWDIAQKGITVNLGVDSGSAGPGGGEGRGADAFG